MIVNNGCDIYKLRISLTEAGLSSGYFYLHKIGIPSSVQLVPFAELVPVSDGGQSRHGFQSCQITWANPDQKTIYKIKKYMEDSLSGTRLLFLTIPKNDGSTLGRSYIDVSGVVIPFYGQESGNFGSPGVVFNGFTLTINNLVILNDPSV